MGAAGLDQFHMPCRQLGQASCQFIDRGQQMIVHSLGSGDMHGGGEAVVGALRAVDMVIGVDWRLAATAFARQFIGASCNHFVGVHVALCTAVCLPHHQRELVVVFTVEHFIGGLFDQAGDIGRQITVAVIDPRGSLFDQDQGMQNRQRHFFVADGKVDQ